MNFKENASSRKLWPTEQWKILIMNDALIEYQILNKKAEFLKHNLSFIKFLFRATIAIGIISFSSIVFGVVEAIYSSLNHFDATTACGISLGMGIVVLVFIGAPISFLFDEIESYQIKYLKVYADAEIKMREIIVGS